MSITEEGRGGCQYCVCSQVNLQKECQKEFNCYFNTKIQLKNISTDLYDWYLRSSIRIVVFFQNIIMKDLGRSLEDVNI